VKLLVHQMFVGQRQPKFVIFADFLFVADILLFIIMVYRKVEVQGLNKFLDFWANNEWASICFALIVITPFTLYFVLELGLVKSSGILGGIVGGVLLSIYCKRKELFPKHYKKMDELN